ncbi:MAG: type II toxin-antitoxin system RelB/DinJ family antitoxin [Clostridiales bacterium]|nr:type II toxin-antitoxin system RelB/DinJ family antitoxin [Clostridiales bacterium]
MANTTTLNIRINPSVKKKAEEVLEELGIPMSTAINMYLRQISLTGGIPFPVKLPKAPENLNAGTMSESELYDKLDKGYNDATAGRVHEASEAFDSIRKKNSI